eukprot:gene22593-29733_t
MPHLMPNLLTPSHPSNSMQHKIFSCWQQLVASELLSDNDCLQPCMKPGSDAIEKVCSAYAELCGAEKQLPDSYLHQDKLATALDMAMPLVSEPSRRKLRLLDENPTSKIVMLVPTVILTIQQAIYFKNSVLGSTIRNFAVDHFSSENPLTSENWEAELSLAVYHIHKDADESLEKHLPQPQQKTPGSERRQLDQDVRYLLVSSLCCASVLVLVCGASELPDSEDVRSLIGISLVYSAKQLCQALTTDALPSASTKAKKKLEELELELTRGSRVPRSSQRQPWHPMHRIHLAWISRAQELSKTALAPHAPDPSRRGGLQESLYAPPFLHWGHLGRVEMSKELSVHATMRAWISHAQDLPTRALAAPAPKPSRAAGASGSAAAAPGLPLRNTVLMAKLLKAGTKAVDMATNLGFECALQFMARKLVSISSRSVNSSSHDRNSRRKKKNASGQKRQWNLGTVEGFGSGDSDSETESMGDLLGLSQLSLELAAVSGRTAADVIATSLAKGKMGGLVMSDVNLSALTVSQAFLHKLLSPLLDETFLTNCVTNHCPPSGQLRQNPHSFPKLWNLVKYLSKYRDDSDFHGIVFATTQHGVFYTSALIRACWKQLGFIDSVHELTGHSGELMEGGAMEGPMRVRGKPSNWNELQDTAERTGCIQGTGPAFASVNKCGRGGPGRTLLQTGVQRVQCWGRVRALQNAEFVVIVQEGSLDDHHHCSCGRGRSCGNARGIPGGRSRVSVRALENSEFVVIVQEGSLDDHHHKKSKTEEEYMLHMLKSKYPWRQKLQRPADRGAAQRVQPRGRVRALENVEFVVIEQEGYLDCHHRLKSMAEENNMLHMLKS